MRRTRPKNIEYLMMTPVCETALVHRLIFVSPSTSPQRGGCILACTKSRLDGHPPPHTASAKGRPLWCEVRGGRSPTRSRGFRQRFDFVLGSLDCLEILKSGQRENCGKMEDCFSGLFFWLLWWLLVCGG